MKNLMTFALFIVALTVSIPSFASENDQDDSHHDHTQPAQDLPVQIVRVYNYSYSDSAAAIGVAASLIDVDSIRGTIKTGVSMAYAGNASAFAFGAGIRLDRLTMLKFTVSTDLENYAYGTSLNWDW